MLSTHQRVSRCHLGRQAIPRAVVLSLLVGLAALGLAALGGCRSEPPASSAPSAPSASVSRGQGGDAEPAAVGAAPAALPSPSPPPVWVAVGGGASPDSNQVSIEQDLAQLTALFGANGALFFAGGPGTQSVQVLAPELQGDPLRSVLGDLFDPRGSRQSRYRATTLAPQGPGTAERFLAEARSALREPGPRLVLYVAAHGDVGPIPRDNAVALWAGSVLTPPDLAEALEDPAAKRPAVVVMSSCYSGGFAEIAFEGAGPPSGEGGPDDWKAPGHASCGLFAAPWDEMSSGCDPNPDRRAQEGFGVHFLHALRGLDRAGSPLKPSDIDFDGDGHISWLEALTRVRVASRSIEVPTTTSERWLRQSLADQPDDVEPAGQAAAPPPVALPEYRAVIRALSQQLGADESSVITAVERLRDQIAQADEAAIAAAEDESRAYSQAAGEILTRWPVLDDPWHPLFEGALREHGDAIAAFVEAAPTMRQYEVASQRSSAAANHADALRVRIAPWRRLALAYETTRLVERLQRRGGAAYQRYLDLLECERAIPPLASQP